MPISILEKIKEIVFNSYGLYIKGTSLFYIFANQNIRNSTSYYLAPIFILFTCVLYFDILWKILTMYFCSLCFIWRLRLYGWNTIRVQCTIYKVQYIKNYFGWQSFVKNIFSDYSFIFTRSRWEHKLRPHSETILILALCKRSITDFIILL